MFSIFLDDYHVRLENACALRESDRAVRRNQVQPKDLVSIMYPLLSINDVDAHTQPASGCRAIREFPGRKFDYTPRNCLRRAIRHYVSTIEGRTQSATTSRSSALKGLIIKLGGLREARKPSGSSAGFTNVLPVQMVAQTATATAPPRGNSAVGAPDPVGCANSPAQRRIESQEFFMQAD